MRFRTSVILVAAFLTALAVSSSAESLTPPQQGSAQTLAASTNTFGLRLLQQLRHGGQDGNVFISPASIMLALAMVYNGADGETKAQMEQALALQGMSLDDLNQGAEQLMDMLQHADTTVKLAIANSVWARAGFPFKQSFIDLTRQAYNAEVRPLTTAQDINTWVTEKTREKITRIVDQIDRDAIMFLINAIYFKGSWTSRFPESATRERDFMLLPGQSIRHPLMEQTGEFSYWEDSTIQAIRLPYGNGTFSMVVLLPREDYAFQRLLDDLTVDYWQGLWRRFSDRDGTIALPRFTIEYDVTLNDPLQALGMTDAFSRQRADFSQLWQRSPDVNVFIQQVRHKTYVQVNEEGTEAAAVTSVEIGVTSVGMQPPPPFNMIVDRPFVCAIVEQTTSSILFAGAIVDPRG